MKVLIDARLYGLENAGLGRYTMNLVEEFQKIDKEGKYVLLLRKNYYESLKLGKNWEKVLADFRHYSAKEQALLPGIIRKQDPDLVHFPHFNVPLFFNGEFVVTIHDLLMHKFKGKEATTLPAPVYGIKRLGYKAVFGNAVKKAKRIIVPSKAVKKEVLKEYGVEQDKVVVTYEGVDEKIVSKNPKKTLEKYAVEGKYFIYVGNAYPHKNIERLIEATFQVNKAEKEKIKLILVSSRDVFVKRLKRKIKEMHAQDCVKVIGFVSDEELGALIESSVAFVYPSLSEGFGLQGLEAMKMETLLVCSNILVFKEVYSDNAIYFNPHDFSAIAQAMSQALSISGEKREKMIKKAKKHANKFSWKKMAQRTLKVYKEAVGE
jgi:glycosyltransferase involved in cell wall biosynthesis